MSEQCVLITGANRGIGLSLVELFLQSGARVIATARNVQGADRLLGLREQHGEEKLLVETVDVATDKSVEDLWGRLENIDKVDVLINNAGVLTEYSEGLSSLSLETIQETFNVNTLGPLRMIRGGLGKLKASTQPKIANISSKVGSIADNSSGYGYAYRVSKTALNMMNKNISLEFPQITSVVLHPGWVQTDMGGQAAPTTPIESAAGLVSVINGLSLADTGKFFDFRGKLIEW